MMPLRSRPKATPLRGNFQVIMNTSDLIFAVDELPEAGLVVRRSWAAERLAETLLQPYEAASPATIELVLERYGVNVHVEGTVGVTLGFQCGRTLAPGRTELRIPIDEVFRPADKASLDFGRGLDSEAFEEEPRTYEGGSLDLEPLVREQLVLAQDPYPVVETGQGAGAGPVWSSTSDEVDPRWEKLRALAIDGRLEGDRPTDRPTDRQTDRQTE